MAGFEVTFNGRFWVTPEDPYSVLREKEQDVERVRKEIQALRTVAEDQIRL